MSRRPGAQRPFKVRKMQDIKWDENPESLLGQGAFGIVYAGTVTHHGVEKKLAIKKLKHVPTDPKDLKAFFSEVELSEQLYYPAIINLLKWYAGEKYLIVTERAVRALDTVIIDEKKGIIASWENSQGEEVKWDLTRKLMCIAGTCFGLAYLHKMGIIHRDMKPANILLDEEMQPHIADFGLSVMLPGGDALAAHFTLKGDVGTPLYMAPEVFKGEKYNGQCDVYSFAIILYELMTNSRPWAGLSYHKIVECVVGGERPVIPGYVPENIAQLIEACWRDNQDDRPTMEEVSKCLSADFLDPHTGEDFERDKVDSYINMLREELNKATPRRRLR